MNTSTLSPYENTSRTQYPSAFLGERPAPSRSELKCKFVDQINHSLSCSALHDLIYNHSQGRLSPENNPWTYGPSLRDPQSVLRTCPFSHRIHDLFFAAFPKGDEVEKQFASLTIMIRKRRGLCGPSLKKYGLKLFPTIPIRYLKLQPMKLCTPWNSPWLRDGLTT